MPDPTVTVEDSLAFGHITEPTPNADGSIIGFLRHHDGAQRFGYAPTPTTNETDFDGDADAVRSVDLEVREYAWRPDYPTQFVAATDQGVEVIDIVDPATGAYKSVTTIEEGVAESLTWVDSDRLVYVREDTVWMTTLGEEANRLPVENCITLPFTPGPLTASPTDKRLAVLVGESDAPLGLVILDLDSGTVEWRHTPPREENLVVSGFDWVTDSHLVYALDTLDATTRTYHSLDLDTDSGPGRTILAETNDIIHTQATPVGNGGGQFAVLSDRSGWAHVYLIDAQTRRQQLSGDESGNVGFDGDGVTRVTAGEFEARGGNTDRPAFAPSGDRLAVATNAADPGERRLWIADTDGTIHHRFDTPGTTLAPTWVDDDRILCMRAGRSQPVDPHLADTTAETMVRIPAADPPQPFEALPDPVPVSIEEQTGDPVFGYYYPSQATESSSPGVIWLHGGPDTQFRRGFPHQRGYAIHHVLNHVLVARGYNVLALNYRGSIGYGHDYEHGLRHTIGVTDLEDCVRAASWLRNQPAVGDRVGVMGRSYGGYLAAMCGTNTDVFDCVIDIAGIWDIVDWVRYATGVGWGTARQFQNYFGGHPDTRNEAVQDRYRRATPANEIQNLTAPVLTLHGTADRNVPIDQEHAQITDLLEEGHDFDHTTYPGEGHGFAAASTWRDTAERIIDHLDTHLR